MGTNQPYVQLLPEEWHAVLDRVAKLEAELKQAVKNVELLERRFDVGAYKGGGLRTKANRRTDEQGIMNNERKK